MTGIADLYLFLQKPHSKDTQARLKALFQARRHEQTRFVVLAWKRTGSNLLCGILHHHPEIVMHNELFNPIDIFTYYTKALERHPGKEQARWNVLGRDLWPEAFLDHIWTGQYADGTLIKERHKAVGFKSFPDHWTDARNEHIWQKAIMDDPGVKKVILFREDELAVYVSMLRAERTGNYMSHPYPKDLKLVIDPAKFQRFVNNYRDTYRRKYKSAFERQDTFRITYEQIANEQTFEEKILPLLWDFLGVNNSAALKKLRETTKQADSDEDLSQIIENYKELEFCFRHSDVLYFKRSKGKQLQTMDDQGGVDANFEEEEKLLNSNWSLLVPVCSRGKISKAPSIADVQEMTRNFNSNRLYELSASSQYRASNIVHEEECWMLLENFTRSLSDTLTAKQLKLTECLVGIDIDDPIYQTESAKKRICSLFPCQVVFVNIRPEMYGKVCKIWNHLASKARNDFLVLLGDDIVLKDRGWQDKIVLKFIEISKKTGLPFGAACVAVRDESFPGFPTFPVVHRWHMKQFGKLLPKQFVNQGGDPFLYELYSRFNAAAFEVDCRLENTIGGDDDARYKKYDINWRGQVLNLQCIHLSEHLSGRKPDGICLDVVVPSYRTNNNDILKSIGSLRSSTNIYTRFWFILDNPENDHVETVTKLASTLNKEQLKTDGNYFINVVHYGENRGASYARNVGYNYSTANWVLFLDDDVIPDNEILDAYVGAIKRYPDAKVFVGLTELPPSYNMWTEMLRTCNIMFFYGAAKFMTHPPWGVTANLMVAGSRRNSTIQFDGTYPKTGGGEDIDFVFQFKKWYQTNTPQGSITGTVVGVPGAKAKHPWWNNGKTTCYRQINGWAWGDSLCITKWPNKAYWCFPNWIEFIIFIVMPTTIIKANFEAGFVTAFSIIFLRHFTLACRYYSKAIKEAKGSGNTLRSIVVAFGAGTVVSAQELTRVVAMVYRASILRSLCRRMDWNDGQQPRFILDAKFGSLISFIIYLTIMWFIFV